MQEIGKRKVDESGRVVLPAELRQKLGIDKNEELSIFINDSEIVMKKAQVSYMMCKKTDRLVIIDNKSFCTDCILKIKEMI